MSTIELFIIIDFTEPVLKILDPRWLFILLLIIIFKPSSIILSWGILNKLKLVLVLLIKIINCSLSFLFIHDGCLILIVTINTLLFLYLMFLTFFLIKVYQHLKTFVLHRWLYTVLIHNVVIICICQLVLLLIKEFFGL